MQGVAPLGGVYQAGTLSGNPLAVARGSRRCARSRDPKSMRVSRNPGRGSQAGLVDGAKAAGLPLTVNAWLHGLPRSFTDSPVTAMPRPSASDTARLTGAFFHAMLDGWRVPRASQFEAAFVGLAHTPRPRRGRAVSPARLSRRPADPDLPRPARSLLTSVFRVIRFTRPARSNRRPPAGALDALLAAVSGSHVFARAISRAGANERRCAGELACSRPIARASIAWPHRRSHPPFKNPQFA